MGWVSVMQFSLIVKGLRLFCNNVVNWFFFYDAGDYDCGSVLYYGGSVLDDGDSVDGGEAMTLNNKTEEPFRNCSCSLSKL